MKIALIFLYLIVAIAARSQWVNVADRLLGDFPVNCCGFGHITYGDGKLWAGRTALHVSDDTGRTWRQVHSFGAVICQIDFIDRFTGLVATTDGVHQTEDGGLTWTKILAQRDCYSAEYCGNASTIIAIADYGGFFYSNDKGNSWRSYNPGGHAHFTLANADGSAFAFADGPGLLLTQDRGATYRQTDPLDGDSFFAARDSAERAIYVVNEGGHVDHDGESAIYKSNDEGLTWKRVGVKPLAYYSAGISAACNTLYVQTTKNGVERSTDGGVTWVGIGGPSNMIDTRTVCAINDNLVLAVAGDGSIWRTDNSGGDSVAVGSTIHHFVFTRLADTVTPEGTLVSILLQTDQVYSGSVSISFDTSTTELLRVYADGIEIPFVITATGAVLTLPITSSAIQLSWYARNAMDGSMIVHFASLGCQRSAQNLSISVPCENRILWRFLNAGELPTVNIYAANDGDKVQLQSTLRGEVRLALSNSIGQTIRSSMIHLDNTGKATVILKDVPAGLYFLCIADRGSVACGRFYKP